ncbi:hypothetical protein OF377_00375 [Ureaplasma sp. ES3154-GEN]|uniref:hypothetical protein n=1 Tax=Ureaplasma sp. ES3154-GEN TaxID=2984844 RepID=UPI0021E7D082|nr:hypothetical protein [Ureaplasma sp. ES3154-GEN]MCV3743343.1 hypothetical protein [Ureaplasma sp. ES3154-GEN]
MTNDLNQQTNNLNTPPFSAKVPENSKWKKIRKWMKTYKGFWVITAITYIFIAILVAILIYAAVNLDFSLKSYNHWIDVRYDIIIDDKYGVSLDNYYALQIFKWGSVVGVMLFCVLILNINIFAYWSYSNHYIPELKEKRLFSSWIKFFTQKQKINKDEKETKRLTKRLTKKKVKISDEQTRNSTTTA